jgi:hypothetical protein
LTATGPSVLIKAIVVAAEKLGASSSMKPKVYVETKLEYMPMVIPTHYLRHAG